MDGLTSLSKKEMEEMREKISEIPHFKITELSGLFSQLTRTILYELVTYKLGYHKFCTSWVAKLLTDNHKTKNMDAALTFLFHDDTEGDDFLYHIVTGNETWVLYINMEEDNL